mmetsp:Transcript_22672/g.59801  ORF Transcript_22672/g.59801 Transcript_22672/m.59801 type:complete len:91 (+) Transcript_22672:1187-1459(+)
MSFRRARSAERNIGLDGPCADQLVMTLLPQTTLRLKKMIFVSGVTANNWNPSSVWRCPTLLCEENTLGTDLGRQQTVEPSYGRFPGPFLA